MSVIRESGLVSLHKMVRRYVMKKQFVVWISLVIILSFATACNLTSSTAGLNLTPTPNANEATKKAASSPSATSAQPTVLKSATATPTKNPLPASATPAPTQTALCTTKVNLKIRSGPGTAYEPPITAVGPNTPLIPFGFNPIGTPGGSWVLVSSEDGTVTGWVSASPDFLTCPIDLNSLPPVQVAPPPPTATPTPTSTPITQGSSPQVSNNGGGGECPQNLVCEINFTSATLYEVNAHSTDSETNGAGVNFVDFSIWNSDETVQYYQRRENFPVYCTFGGDGPCSGWIYEDGAFRWYSGEAAVEPGDYVVIIDVQGTTPDESGVSSGQWRLSLTISAP
jgi:hypothetical protein